MHDLQEIFGSELPAHRPHGVLSVEHSPAPADPEREGEGDGICLTLLVSVRQPLEEVTYIVLSIALNTRDYSQI
jgi:8-oxo-dGDP phosphatase